MKPYVMRRAHLCDLPAVLCLLADSAAWMHQAGWDAWPRNGFPEDRITPSLDDATLWVMSTAGGAPVGTLTLDQNPDPEFLAPEAKQAKVTELLPHAWIGHRLAVNRSLAGQGLGVLMVEWSIDWVCRAGGKWRLTNVNRRAVPLQRWYADLGFSHLATVQSTPRKSGSLWGRPAQRIPRVHQLLTELT